MQEERTNVMAMRKHPAPVHLRPKVDLNQGTGKKLALSQCFLSAQASADPQNKLGPQAASLAAARHNLTGKLARKADIKATLDLAQADLVVAIDQHDQAMKNYARDAAKLAGADVSALATLGVEAATRAAKGANDNVDAPEALGISPGANPGAVRLKCGKVAHATAYVFEYKVEPSQPADPWLPEGGIQTKRVSTTLTGLAPGQAIRARARAIGGMAGPWSEEVVGRAK
jgi:hypothetical protein